MDAPLFFTPHFLLKLLEDEYNEIALRGRKALSDRFLLKLLEDEYNEIALRGRKALSDRDVNDIQSVMGTDPADTERILQADVVSALVEVPNVLTESERTRRIQWRLSCMISEMFGVAIDVDTSTLDPDELKAYHEILEEVLQDFPANRVKEALEKQFSVDLTALGDFIYRHTRLVSSTAKKIYQIDEDLDSWKIQRAFYDGHKEQLLGYLEYGIDILLPWRDDDWFGKEQWLIDILYGRDNKCIFRDMRLDDTFVILRAYRKAQWKISQLGGSVEHWNRRRHFVAFLEKYVINMKNQELREKAKDLFSIVIVQSAIMSYL